MVFTFVVNVNVMMDGKVVNVTSLVTNVKYLIAIPMECVWTVSVCVHLASLENIAMSVSEIICGNYRYFVLCD